MSRSQVPAMAMPEIDVGHIVGGGSLEAMSPGIAFDRAERSEGRTENGGVGSVSGILE